MTYFLIYDSLTITLLVLFVTIFIYHIYNLRTNNIFHRLKIPGPAPIPFLGEIFNVVRKGMYANDVDLTEKYGKVIGIFEGTTPAVLLTDPELLRDVLIKHSNIFVNRRTMEGTTGIMEYGLTSLKDEHWKNARSIVSPTFSSAKLKTMYGLMNHAGEIYNKRLLEYADKQEIFDIRQLNGQYTLDNIASCLFGIETNSLQDENVTLINHLKKFFTLSFANLFLLVFFLSPRLARRLGEKGYSMVPRGTMNYLTQLLNQILSRRRQHFERRNDFIQIMVDHEEEQAGKSSKVLNDKEILGQAAVFLVAGYETTSVLMSFFFYTMATEPVIQEKIHEEIRDVLGDDEITYEKLQQLSYLDMVISETLRMYPPFTRFERVASEDYQMGEYHLPKGMVISVPVYSLHHDPQFWPEPEKFIPERFSPEEKAKRHPMAYLPFGEGPRNCIGMRFALLETKLAIVKSMRLLEIQKCEKTEIPIQLGQLTVLSSKNPIWIRVMRRSQ